MGWRNVKDFFKIDYIVHLNRDGNLCVGTISLPELIIVCPSGEILKRYDGNQKALIQLQEDFENENLKLITLLRKEDKQKRGAPIFYFDERGVHEDTYIIGSLPVVTDSGRLLVDKFYLTKNEAIEEAIKTTRLKTEQLREKLRDLSIELEANDNLLDELLSTFQNRPCNIRRLG